MLETLGAVLFVQTPVQKENGAISVLLEIGFQVTLLSQY